MRWGTPLMMRSKLEKESLISGPLLVITNSRMPLSCQEPRILNTFNARAISPLISTYCSIRIVSVMVEIWESVIEWLPINSSEVLVKKPAISSCLA